VLGLIFCAAVSVRADPVEQRPSDDPAGNLSEKLERSEGVIKPRENVDPGLHVQPPESADKMPVIPPPGTPEGNRDVRPK
jgi:hypothetical protein